MLKIGRHFNNDYGGHINSPDKRLKSYGFHDGNMQCTKHRIVLQLIENRNDYQISDRLEI